MFNLPSKILCSVLHIRLRVCVVFSTSFLAFDSEFGKLLCFGKCDLGILMFLSLLGVPGMPFPIITD